MNDDTIAPAARTTSEESRVARSAGVVGAATMLSRILGLVREQVMSYVFGAGFATDAFNVAFRIPNLLRDLFAEGAMSSAFVPTFTRVRKEQGEDAAFAFGRALMVTLLLLLSIVCALGAIFTPALVTLFAPGFATVPGKHELTVLLTRVMLPFLPAVALAAAVMGMLNARGVFGVPALAPAFLNVGMIVGGLALMPVCRALGQPEILAMALGVLLGGLAQLAVQLPTLHRLGFRFRFESWRRHPAVERVGALMLPATVGLAGTQINLLVSTIIASALVEGSVSWLWYAFRLMQLPIGVFGVALATVSLPALSRAAVDHDLPAVRTTLSATVRLVFVLTVPAAVWLAIMSRPVIALLYQHGRFTFADTVATAGALEAYALGLPAFAAVGVMTRACYALGDTRTPLRASLIAVAVNLALNLLFVGPWRELGLEHRGLALATSLTSLVNLAQLAWGLGARLGGIEGRRILVTILKVLIASSIAAAACLGLVALLGEWWSLSPLTEAVTVASSAGLAVLIGWPLMRLLRVEELAALEGLGGSLASRLTGRRS